MFIRSFRGLNFSGRQSHVRRPISTTLLLSLSFVSVVMRVKNAISFLRTNSRRFKWIFNKNLEKYKICNSSYFKRQGKSPFTPMPIFSHAAAINSNLGSILMRECVNINPRSRRDNDINFFIRKRQHVIKICNKLLDDGKFIKTNKIK